jgi:hypothetical protein
MKMNTKIALVLGVAALTATTAMAKPGNVDSLHFAIKIPLLDQGVEAGSSGTVSANEVRNHGTVNNQKLTVTVRGLTANTGYSLVATTAGGTTDLEDFTTDSNGSATLNLVTTKNGKTPKNATALPDGFELAGVTQLDVDNAGSTSVLSTSGAKPSAVTYSVKRSLTGPDGETGTLQINANTKHTKFTLNGSGFQPNTDYVLFLNGAQDQTVTTNSKGQLRIKAATTLPTNILDLNSVQVQDTGGNVIFDTTLP